VIAMLVGLAIVAGIAMPGCGWLGGTGEAKIVDPFEPESGTMLTQSQLEREAARRLAEATAAAEQAAAAAERAARTEAQQVLDARLDGEADLELDLAALRTKYAKRDRELGTRLAQLEGDVQAAMDAAARNLATSTREIDAAVARGRDGIAAIEANRAALVDGAGQLATIAGSLGVPGVGLLAGLIPAALAGLGWSRSSAKAAAEKAKREAGDAAWDEAKADERAVQTRIDTTWDQAQMQSLLTALLAERLGVAKTTNQPAADGRTEAQSAAG
jgi:hypothetical protein